MRTRDLAAMRVALLSMVGMACTADAEPAGVPVASLPCEDEPLVIGGLDDPAPGWGVCEDGSRHRAQAEACSLPPGDCSDGGGCTSDAECTDAPNGRCILVQGCACHYGCETDADCGADEACLCLGLYSQCIPAQCRSDDDCADAACVLTESDSLSCTIGGNYTMQCQSPDDACHSSADCPAGEICSASEGPAQCVADPQPCADAGRPFMVDNHARVAKAASRRDWTQLASGLAGATPRVAAEVAESYVRAGLAEHASIASFARFALQLLAVGAPATLVADALAAASDEVQHARVCFGIAAAYGSTATGPAALPMHAALDGGQELAVVAAAVIEEGCIGETLAAAEVAEAARHVASEGLRDALLAIADDELRHAALAWRFVRWARAQGTTEQAAAIDAALRDAIEAARDELSAARPVADAGLLRAHGVLAPAERIAIRRAALRDVVAGCAAAVGCDRSAETRVVGCRAP